MSLYPLQFRPRMMEKIWGGRKIETVLGKPLPPGLYGESWEIYDFPPGVLENSSDWISAPVANGPLAGKTLHEVVKEFGRAVHGDVPLAGEQGQFPILIKYLDAKEDLSVQVHPDVAYCASHQGAYLKNEAWYVVQADPGGRLLKGLVPGTTKADLEKSIQDGTVERYLKTFYPKPGECFYLPSGTIHALGQGLLVAEVQTPSDTTYRVYDYGRIDATTGKPRALHIQQALDCIDFAGHEKPQPRRHVASFFTTVTRLCTCDYFTMEKVRFSEGVEEAVPYDQPVVWMMQQGQAQIRVADLPEPVTLSAGDTVLLPAEMKNPVLKTLQDCVWIEVTFPTR